MIRSALLFVALLSAAACSLRYPKDPPLRCTQSSNTCPQSFACRVDLGLCCRAGECCTHSECAAPGFCPTAGGGCRNCTFAECTMACEGQADCPIDWLCDGHGVCRKRCAAGCEPEAADCDQGLCIGCSDGACPAGFVCAEAVRACLALCGRREDCPAGRGCYLLAGARVCAQAGTRGRDESCSKFNECGLGLDCTDGRCQPGPG